MMDARTRRRYAVNSSHARAHRISAPLFTVSILFLILGYLRLERR